jgi:hypothetical protein
MAKDFFHHHVKQVLKNDGWTITHDPFRVEYEGDEYEMDLGAERLIAAEKDMEKIVVEIKSFLKTSVVYQFHDALGQYMNYLIGLKLAKETERRLFLALSHTVYNRLSESPLLMASIEAYKVNILVFDANKPEVVSWIKF